MEDYTQNNYCDLWRDDDDPNNAYCYTGTQATVGPRLWKGGYDGPFDNEKEWSKFQCTRQEGAHWWAYRADKDLPKRVHYYDGGDRIPKIVMMMEDEWYSSKSERSTYSLVGNHGYDNNFSSMRALFLGHFWGRSKTKLFWNSFVIFIAKIFC